MHTSDIQFETVIGIVPDTPGAPKAARSWPAKNRALKTREDTQWLELELESTTNPDLLPSPPTSRWRCVILGDVDS